MGYALAVGTTLHNGNYVIDRVIGEGGFGITYAAHHTQKGTQYALKELFIGGACVRNTKDNTSVELQGLDKDKYEHLRFRFFTEASTLISLDNPHVVKVEDVFSENNTSYIVMQFIPGSTLYNSIVKNGPLDYETAINYLAQLCEAVDYLHSKHILHRDIKPDNVMITPDGKVVLIDFGSAREFAHNEVANHTVMITDGYAPIEQYAANTQKGNYTDIYAIGALAYFLFTGKKPLSAPDRAISDSLVEPMQLNPDVPVYVNSAVMKAMQLQPQNRYQLVDYFLADLLNDEDIFFRAQTIEQLSKQEVVDEPIAEVNPLTNSRTKTDDGTSPMTNNISNGRKNFAPPFIQQSLVTFNSVYEEYNVIQNGAYGMVIHADIVATNLINNMCKLFVYFSYDDYQSTPIEDLDGLYCNSDGYVCAIGSFMPMYSPTQFPDFCIFMPYYQLHIPQGLVTRLKYRVVVTDSSLKTLAVSPWHVFSFQG